MRRTEPEPWMRAGAPCWYHPIIDRDQRFPGWLVGEPRQLGGEGGPWVCRVTFAAIAIRDDEPAAVMAALRPRRVSK